VHERVLRQQRRAEGQRAGHEPAAAVKHLDGDLLTGHRALERERVLEHRRHRHGELGDVLRALS